MGMRDGGAVKARVMCAFAFVSMLHILFGCGAIPSASEARTTTYFYASQSGTPTLDSDDTGGNPFATALVEVLGRTVLDFGGLRSGVVDITLAKSGGFQRPAQSGLEIASGWTLIPAPPDERRVALVLMFSDYGSKGPFVSLPGARFDAKRIGDALSRAGFLTTVVVDPAAAALPEVLERFAGVSAAADMAVIYTTGHGAEVAGGVYLLPGSYPQSDVPIWQPDHAIPLTRLAGSLRSRRANLLFYGGCRDNPFARS